MQFVMRLSNELEVSQICGEGRDADRIERDFVAQAVGDRGIRARLCRMAQERRRFLRLRHRGGRKVTEHRRLELQNVVAASCRGETGDRQRAEIRHKQEGVAGRTRSVDIECFVQHARTDLDRQIIEAITQGYACRSARDPRRVDILNAAERLWRSKIESSRALQEQRVRSAAAVDAVGRIDRARRPRHDCVGANAGADRVSRSCQRIGLAEIDRARYGGRGQRSSGRRPGEGSR